MSSEVLGILPYINPSFSPERVKCNLYCVKNPISFPLTISIAATSLMLREKADRVMSITRGDIVPDYAHAATSVPADYMPENIHDTAVSPWRLDEDDADHVKPQ
ncbi:hypothetical protein CWS02_13970 [Enterobacter sp. EA-1]|nr:hypothetical protein CWS02_13970 [Enterobacter sp. EA-1]